MASRARRTGAAVVVVLLLLLTVWAVYNLVSVAQASSTPSEQKVGNFVAASNGSFVAALLPNTLCNCSEITGGNATLFPAITRWVNVSLGTSVTVTAPSDITVLDLFSVTLWSSGWSKPLLSFDNRTSVTGGTALPVSNTYTFNFSAVQLVIGQIDEQLGYSPTMTGLTVSAVVVGSVATGGGSASFQTSSVGNFTFEPSTVATGFLARSAEGPVFTSGGADGPVPTIDYLLPAVAAIALAGSVWWYASLVPGSAGTSDGPIPDLEELIGPYEEVIAETATVPDPAATAVIDRWEDLVKIADTLGKPILRPVTGRKGSPSRSFFVLDGDVGYVYRYHSLPAYVAAPLTVHDIPGGSARLLERVRADASRIEALPPTDPRFPRALAQFRRVRALLQARRWGDAEHMLDELERLLAAPPAAR